MSMLFRDVGRRCLFPQGSVVCIGAFDGLHLGHRALVGQARARAQALGLPLVSLTFEPLPRELFAHNEPSPRLTLMRAKVEGLWDLGVDCVGLLRFKRKMAGQLAEDFVQQVLVGQLQAREVWIGPEFRFGYKRGGDIGLLNRMGAELGFVAREIASVFCEGGGRISSTRIRQLLTDGEFADAQELLGRPYSIGGRVVHGRKLGRSLGFPTANLRFPKSPALSGVYACWVHGVGEVRRAAVASFGTRPTVGGVEPLLEAHLFDYAGDLYGQHIEVEFVAKLRDELKFSDLAALTVQMHDDARQARRILKNLTTASDVL